MITIKDQVFKNYFAPPTVIFHRMVLEKTGMFPSMMKYMEDAFFFNKIIYHYKCILLNERVACCICQREDGEIVVCLVIYGRWKKVNFTICDMHITFIISIFYFLALLTLFP